MSNILCIYAITGSANVTTFIQPEVNIGIKGMANTETFAIGFKGISAVVSKHHKTGFIHNQKTALDYAKTIESISQTHNILPLRFGTFVKSRKDVTDILSKHYDEFVLNLNKVNNKSEFGLKILCDSKQIENEIRRKYYSKENELKSTFHNGTPARSYLQAKFKEHLIEKELLKETDQIIKAINKRLDTFTSEMKSRKMITKNILVDAVYLIEKNQKEGFIDAIKNMESQYDNMNFVLTGPWPPYSFTDLTTK